jgi:hypothetical protein
MMDPVGQMYDVPQPRFAFNVNDLQASLVLPEVQAYLPEVLGPLPTTTGNDLGNLLRGIANGPGAPGLLPGSGFPMGAGSAFNAMHMGAANGRGALPANPMTGQTEEFFTYSPGTVNVAVGQPVEARPVLGMALGQYVFAIAPDLPRGLMIDNQTGLIHGIAQEATDGPAKFFVTLVETCSVKVQIAIVHVNILNIRAPGKHITNLVHHSSGMTTVTLHDAPVAPGLSLMPYGPPNGGYEPSAHAHQAAQVLVSQVQDQLMNTVAALRSACAAQQPPP